MILDTTTRLTPLTRTELDDLISETADWHRRAQQAIDRGDTAAASAAYAMRESLARYIAARTTNLGFQDIRARAIIVARTLP